MIKEIFKEKGIKVTKARIAIYELLEEEIKGITADYIYMVCRQRGYNINLSTVYRTLDIFEEKELVDKFLLGEGIKNFIIKKKNHNHIVECDLCHKEIEVPCPMHQIEEILKNQTGFTLTDHSITLKGICEECNEDKNE